MNEPAANPIRRAELLGLLGDLPDRTPSISATTLDVSEHDGYLLEKLVLDLNGIETVPAYFARPATGSGPWPTVLYNHAHGGDYTIGKDEFLNGRDALQSPGYAKALTSNGYAALCIDHWCFCERKGNTESATFKEMLWNGQVLWGMMVFDSLRAIDYLMTRPDVDMNRLATLGLSLGSTMAWWVSALDTRIKVCIDICCLTDFDSLIESRGLDGHNIYYYVPSLLKHFTASQINALIAPRPHLRLAGNYDSLTPVAGLERIDRELKRAYREAGNEAAWKMLRYNIGHFETAAMRVEIFKFLEQWL